jgi:hypothetical protein
MALASGFLLGSESYRPTALFDQTAHEFHARPNFVIRRHF